MRGFARHLLTEWRRLGIAFAGQTFLIAVSGGADSAALALALRELFDLKKLRHRFIIAHFNHCLRGAESEADAEFVKDLAENLGFEFAGGSQDLTSKIRDQKGNLEQTARRARYRFLAKCAESYEADGVLTAHTLNDQAETLLLNLIRGSGLEGLAAMRAVRELNAEDSPERFELNDLPFSPQPPIPDPKFRILLVRPLLNWAQREMTECFCRQNKVDFRSDSMNDDAAFSRVRVRKELLPLLRSFNPKIVEGLARTAFLLRADSEALETIAADFALPETEALRLDELKNVPKPLRSRIIRLWLKQRRGTLRRLTTKHIEAIEALAESRKSGKTIELPGGETVVKRRGRLVFEKTKVEKSPLAN